MTFGIFKEKKSALPLALLGLLLLFSLRVFGQLLVALGYSGCLPPMDQWQSGLLPYPVLFACQLALIGLFGKICLDIAGGAGFFAKKRLPFGEFLIKFSHIYYAAMFLRYAVQMYLHPQDRWFGHTIAIAFHIVLATYVLLLGYYNKLPTPRSEHQSAV